MINTQGHQVQVMPTYSPLDPSRVTFNPAGFTQGALSSIELMDQLARQRAFQQAQAELAATRDGRLGALNAQNLATIQLAPQKNIADIALAQQQAALIPGQTQAGLADQQFAQDIRPFVQGAKRQQAETDDALAVQKADMQIVQARLDAEKQTREGEQAPLKGALDLAKLTQDFENLDKDKSMSDSQKLATIRNTLASAAQSEAAARKADRDDTKPVDPLKKIDDLQMQIQRLKSEEVLNPGADNLGTPMPVIKYQGATRGPDGKPLMQKNENLVLPWTWGDRPTQVPLNPAAEKKLNQIKILEDQLDALTSSLSAPQSSSGEPAPTPAPVAPKAATAPKTSSGAKQITSKAEFDALKPGDPFIFNGKAGVKTK